MKKQKTQNTNKGITLIALVITIIVMLILVAVTISMAVNGGLFEYAQYAGTRTNEAVANEQLLASGRVDIDGTVYNSITEYVNSGKTGGITASEMQSDLKSYLGKQVNYEVSYDDRSSYGNGKWEIFYADEEHIYLITKGHLPYACPKTKDNNGAYYNGSSDFTAGNLQTRYPAVAGSSLLKISSNKSTMRATQYLLDSDVWNSYAPETNMFADWAIGAPTFDLFVKSYNELYPNNKIEDVTTDSYGYSWPFYNISMTGNVLSHSDATRYWLACPLDGNYMGAIDGRLNLCPTWDGLDIGSCAFRPVVCLKSGVKLTWSEATSEYLLSL